ncbi:hypothetical protein ABZ135_02185 [Streptomyces sp. NPDC006339]|uniref:hypothetical protein n=1 Tax=Streptomyces sp. NPDC006339 TaxID=3156755 RepID=UPI0033B7CEFC
MTDKSNWDISAEISELKALLLYDEARIMAKYDGDHQEKDPKKQPKEEPFLVTKLKATLIDESPKIVTDAMLPFNFVKRFAEMYEELQKEQSSELLEAFGLDGVGAAVEKFHEDHENRWNYFWSALSGIVVPLIIGGLVIVFRRLILDGFRWLQSKMFKGDVYALNETQTRIQRQPLQNVKDRELQGAAVVLTDPPDAARLNELKQALGDINRRIINFNKAVTKFPSPRTMAKTAEGVSKINDAITASNAEKIDKVAQAINSFDPTKVPDARKLDKLNKAVDKSKPATIRELARVIGKLVGAQQHLEPQRWQELPKARTLSSAAKSAERLAKAGLEVGRAFDSLKTAAQQAAAAI